MSVIFEIPDKWELCKLDLLIEKMTNGSSATQYNEKVGYPISRIETIWNESIDLNRVKYVKENDEDFLAKYALHDNDILFSHINSDNHLGKTAIYKIKSSATLIHGINLLLLRPSMHISAEFLNYQFKYLRKKGKFSEVAQKAVNQSSINQGKLKQFDILVPPFKEQNRIVEKIEELFSDLDNGIETLEKALKQLKVYRQAVLSWAYEGKLTNKVSNGELPNGWKFMQLKDVAKVIGGVTKGRKFKGRETVMLPYLRVANVQDGYLDLREIKKIEVLPTDLEKYRLIEGDILYTEGGDKDKLGRGTLWRNQIEDCIHQNHVFRARITDADVKPEYIAYFSQTKQAKDYFFKKAKQTVNLASINLTVLSQLNIPIPGSDEQERVLAEVESRLSVCDKIEEMIETALKQSEALRYSILKKAFEGKLVPQDPNDEPASVLLERIKAEREQNKPVKKVKEKKVKAKKKTKQEA